MPIPEAQVPESRISVAGSESTRSVIRAQTVAASTSLYKLDVQEAVKTRQKRAQSSPGHTEKVARSHCTFPSFIHGATGCARRGGPHPADALRQGQPLGNPQDGHQERGPEPPGEDLVLSSRARKSSFSRTGPYTPSGQTRLPQKCTIKATWNASWVWRCRRSWIVTWPSRKPSLNSVGNRRPWPLH